MLLSKKKVWNIVNGDYPQPRDVEDYTDEEYMKFTKTVKEKIEKDVYKWCKGNEEALRTIYFTISDELQGPICSGKTAKGTWDELQQVHVSNDKQHKFSLLHRLYHLNISPNGPLVDHK
jgi:gag-polypeptide of LTR copia-type